MDLRKLTVVSPTLPVRRHNMLLLSLMRFMLRLPTAISYNISIICIYTIHCKWPAFVEFTSEKLKPSNDSLNSSCLCYCCSFLVHAMLVLCLCMFMICYLACFCSCSKASNIYIYIYIHTHKHIYIYICIERDR